MNQNVDYVRCMNILINKRLRREQRMSSESQRRAVAKYDATNTKQIKMKLNLETDKDILAKLEAVGNVQGYIKRLIREDIEKAVK